MAQLERLGPVEVNAIDMKGTDVLHANWQAPEAFQVWLSRGAFPQGDIFVRAPTRG